MNVLRPEISLRELISTVEGTSSELATKITASAKAGLEMEANLPPALALFGLDVTGKGSAEMSGAAEGSGKKGNSNSNTFSPIKTPERHLEKLISLYAERYGLIRIREGAAVAEDGYLRQS